MDADVYCATNMIDDGTCDYDAVQAAIAKDQAISQKVEILCHMLRVGFDLKDTYKAGFDATDCDSASKEVSPREVCNDVRDFFDDGACASAAPFASSSSKDNSNVTSIIIAVSAAAVTLVVLAVLHTIIRKMTSGNRDAFVEVERRALTAKPQSTPPAFINPAYTTQGYASTESKAYSDGSDDGIDDGDLEC